MSNSVNITTSNSTKEVQYMKKKCELRLILQFEENLNECFKLIHSLPPIYHSLNIPATPLFFFFIFYS